ncbi:hypothetical protein [Halorussus sp. AFM4]|uniref:hypothetical protein n=1 Tax=Halorussus sp. AFM4 TaxID=3421651 RepID=UPI003EBC6E33
MKTSKDPEQYVNENAEQLVRIIKHSSKSFPRALALAALVEYGDDPAVESVAVELEQFVEYSEKDAEDH